LLRTTTILTVFKERDYYIDCVEVMLRDNRLICAIDRWHCALNRQTHSSALTDRGTTTGRRPTVYRAG